MFEFVIKKEHLLPSLLSVSGAVDKKQSLAILSNLLLKLSTNQLLITATDLEIEMSARIVCEFDSPESSITVPAKKFIDIVKSLDDHSDLKITSNDHGLIIKQGRSSFKLATLPADNYPLSEDSCNEVELSVNTADFLKLLQSTHFSMSQQDVRIFLNGLFLEFDSNLITAVATDGHRMAIDRYSCSNSTQGKFLIPKKGIQELLRLLGSIQDENIVLTAGKSHFKVFCEGFTFTSKLIDSRFPPYVKAIPKAQDKSVLIDCALLKRSLSRTVILAHEKSRAVLLHVQSGQLTLIANNNEQEEAIESVAAHTEGDEIKIGLNATYLLDVLNYFSDGEVRLSMSHTDSSILVESPQHEHYQYILMPMKI